MPRRGGLSQAEGDGRLAAGAAFGNPGDVIGGYFVGIIVFAHQLVDEEAAVFAISERDHAVLFDPHHLPETLPSLISPQHAQLGQAGWSRVFLERVGSEVLAQVLAQAREFAPVEQRQNRNQPHPGLAGDKRLLV